MPSKSQFGGSSPTNVDNTIDFDVSVSKCPPTAQRKQAIDTDAFINKPAIARANLAVSTSTPDGSPESRNQFKDYVRPCLPFKALSILIIAQTVLQQHVLFWDRDADGAIYPWDTFTGFRDLGFSLLLSLFAVVIINVSFSYPTRIATSYWPDPWFRVWVGSIHKAKVSSH